MSAARAGARILATWFGSGLSPVVPGTVGTLASLPLAFALGRLASPFGYAAATALLFAAGVWASDRVCRELRDKDPGRVVIDETVGLLVTVAFLPPSPAVLAGGFLLFRVTDILKPFPARRLESLPGGWGIMADDVVAGLYANLLLRAGLALAAA